MTDERQSASARREQRIRDAVASLGDVRADPALRERLKREFIGGAIAGPVAEARRSPHWWWILVPAAAVVVMIVLFLPRPAPTWSVRAVLGEGQLEVDGQTLTAHEQARLAQSLRSGGRVRVDEGLTLDLILDDSLLLELDEGADVMVPSPPEPESRGPLVSEVHAGELRIKTGPSFPADGFHILTAEGRTEIVGTIVSVYKGDGLTCVCVLEGTARIGADESRLEEIPQGMRKVMFGDGRPSMVTEIQPQHAAGLREFEQRYADVFEPQE